MKAARERVGGRPELVRPTDGDTGPLSHLLGVTSPTRSVVSLFTLRPITWTPSGRSLPSVMPPFYSSALRLASFLRADPPPSPFFKNQAPALLPFFSPQPKPFRLRAPGKQRAGCKGRKDVGFMGIESPAFRVIKLHMDLNNITIHQLQALTAGPEHQGQHLQ